jgi:hypothetical protein
MSDMLAPRDTHNRVFDPCAPPSEAAARAVVAAAAYSEAKDGAQVTCSPRHNSDRNPPSKRLINTYVCVVRQAPPMVLVSTSAQYGELTRVLDARMHAKQSTTRNNRGVPPWLSAKLRGRRAFVLA